MDPPEQGGGGARGDAGGNPESIYLYALILTKYEVAPKTPERFDCNLKTFALIVVNHAIIHVTMRFCIYTLTVDPKGFRVWSLGFRV